jgi:site-specific DNA recombinase
MTRRDPASPMLTRKRRCAVYTRKSTDEGLEKEFNSLDAQRESCEAYIASQRSEGWVLVHDRYDDGGVSGGTLERPALKRLLADIEAGLVDVVVVYKIDRLSRSLMDFAKLVQIFDQNEVTFVSVTQSFNTTTSMGRLTLNILLSFAQFEREVIGERVRDKIAASRARGMWMGGPVPLGYRVENRKLLIDEAAAATVRRVFEGFAEIGSVTQLLPILRAEGLLTKHRRPFDKGAVYKLLANRVYLGEAVHKGKSYPGEHAAIIPQALWNQVHEIMATNPHMRAGLARNRSPALLRGLIFGADGRALSPTHTRKQGRLYRYYVSQSVLKGGADDAPYPRTKWSRAGERFILASPSRALASEIGWLSHAASSRPRRSSPRQWCWSRARPRRPPFLSSLRRSVFPSTRMECPSSRRRASLAWTRYTISTGASASRSSSFSTTTRGLATAVCSTQTAR